MIETKLSLQQSALRAMLAGAVMTLAQREAEKAVKRAIRDKGVRKISQVKRSEIAALGREYLIAHPELIAQAKPVIERCERGGFFGKRAARTGHILFQTANTSPINVEAVQ
jgi:hypothetical protein